MKKLNITQIKNIMNDLGIGSENLSKNPDGTYRVRVTGVTIMNWHQIDSAVDFSLEDHPAKIIALLNGVSIAIDSTDEGMAKIWATLRMIDADRTLTDGSFDPEEWDGLPVECWHDNERETVAELYSGFIESYESEEAYLIDVGMENALDYIWDTFVEDVPAEAFK